jgi:hypothetical protein
MGGAGDRPYVRLMAQLGADDVEVDRLAATIDRTASRLTTVEESISSSVRSIAWTGPDADAFRGKWNSGMRSQLTTVSQHLHVVAKGLRRQAAQQRQASASSGVVLTAPRFETAEERALRELWEARAEAARRRNEAENWAKDIGRRQIRELADKSEQEQLDWWNSLTDDQRAAILRADPGALFGLEGLPADVRADARDAYLDSVRSGIQISSSQDKLKGELNVAWVHLGVEGSAAIVQLADGTYRVDLKLDGEIGANLGKGNAQANLGGAVSQSYTFDSKADAEAFVNGLYDKLSPEPDWDWFGGPGAVIAGTVDDVVNFLGDHSDHRTKFEGELRLEGKLELKAGAFDINLEGQAGARYDFDKETTTVFVGGSFEFKDKLPSVAPVDGAGDTGSLSVKTNLEAAVKFDADGNVTELNLSGTVSGSASAGVEQFFNGTNASSKVPEKFQLSVSGGVDVKFNAKLDMTDPIVQQAAAELLNGMNNGGVTMEQLQELLGESALQVQVNTSATASEGFDIGIASLDISTTQTENVVTWVKPPGGDFTFVPRGELVEDRR